MGGLGCRESPDPGDRQRHDDVHLRRRWPPRAADGIGRDDDGRADSTDLGAKWTERAGDWHIVSNTLRNKSTGGAPEKASGTSIVASYNGGPYGNVGVTSKVYIVSGSGSALGGRLFALRRAPALFAGLVEPRSRKRVPRLRWADGRFCS